MIIELSLLIKKNSGVGNARNKGLDIATGEFISFIDSDDTIDKNFFEVLYESAIKTDAQIIESGAKVILSKENIIYPYSKKDKILICNNEEYMKNYLNFSANVSVWGKIYRRDLISNTRFPDLNINEDFIFLWEIVKKTKSYCENLNVNYHYYLDKEKSLSKTPFSHNNMSMLDHLINLVNDVKTNYPNLIDDALNHYSACLLHTLILYHNYINSDDLKNSGQYFLEDKDKLIQASQYMIPISSYLLLHESEYDVNDLINDIEQKVGGKKL